MMTTMTKRNEYKPKWQVFNSGPGRGTGQVPSFDSQKISSDCDPGTKTKTTSEPQLAPLSLSRFVRELSSRTFTNGTSDRPLVIRQYGKHIRKTFRRLSNYQINHIKWDDNGLVKVADLIGEGHMQKLDWLSLLGKQFRPRGCQALADGMSTSCPLLVQLDVSHNSNIGDAGLYALTPVLPRRIHLDVSSCGLSDISCHVLAYHLIGPSGGGFRGSSVRQLRWLNSRENKYISDAGCESLFALMEYLTDEDELVPRGLFIQGATRISIDAIKRLSGIWCWNVT